MSHAATPTVPSIHFLVSASVAHRRTVIPEQIYLNILVVHRVEQGEQDELGICENRHKQFLQ